MKFCYSIVNFVADNFDRTLFPEYYPAFPACVRFMSRKASNKSNSAFAEFDAWSFCRTKQELKFGSLGVESGLSTVEGNASDEEWYFSRLTEEPLLQSFRLDNWSISGSQNKRNECILKFRGQLSAVFSCAHCGKPVPDQINIHRNLLLRVSEQDAEAYDQDSLDELTDVVACPGAINLQEWFEDELMLSLPMLPRHEECEENLDSGLIENYRSALEEVDEDQPQGETVRPFAGLGDLIKFTKK